MTISTALVPQTGSTTDIQIANILTSRHYTVASVDTYSELRSLFAGDASLIARHITAFWIGFSLVWSKVSSYTMMVPTWMAEMRSLLETSRWRNADIRDQFGATGLTSKGSKDG